MEPEVIHLKPRRPEGILARLADKAKKIPPLRRFVLRVTKKTPAFRNIIRQCRMFVGGGLSSKELLLSQHNFFREWRDVVSQQEWAARSRLTPVSLAPAASCPAPSLTVFPSSDQKKMLFPANDEIFPEVYSTVIDDAHVIPGSNTILANGSMIFHDLFDPGRQLAPEEMNRLFEFNEVQRKARLKSSLEVHHELAEAAHFLDAAAQNYAHWITEILPRIVMFCKIEANKNIPILVDDKLPATIWQTLALAVGPHRKVYVLSPVISVKVKKLHLISVSGYIPFGFRGTIDREALHGKYSPVALASVRELAIESIKGEQVQKALPRKFFIRRKSSSRRLLNQDQIEEMVLAEGFSIISPEELTFLEQVRLFNEAESIIGPTGAAFANVIFCNPSAKVTILIAENPETAYFYWPKLASVAGARLSYVLGRVEGDASEGVHRDFSISTETMGSFLKESCADE
jgi:capsular polysaccharide biosynthesis protein